MREFISSPFPGRSISSTLLAKMARTAQRTGFTVPGSAGSGWRGTTLSSDQPQVTRVIQHLQILDVKINDFVERPNVRLVGNANGGETVDKNIYLGRIVRYNTVETDALEPPVNIYDAGIRQWQPEDQLYEIDTSVWFNQFLLTASSKELPVDEGGNLDASKHRWGDIVACSYDYLSGRFVLLNPVSCRAGVVLDKTIVAGSFGRVDLFQHTGDFKQEFTSANVRLQDARTDWLQHSVGFGDKVVLIYLDETWQIINVTSKAQFIHFVLDEDLTFSTQFATARLTEPEIFYGGGINPVTHGIPSSTFDVRNPTAGCAGTTFRFEGSEGCKGQAIWDSFLRVYHIWQLDCDIEPPSDD